MVPELTAARSGSQLGVRRNQRLPRPAGRPRNPRRSPRSTRSVHPGGPDWRGAGNEIIYHANPDSFPQQCLYQVRADETSTAGNKCDLRCAHGRYTLWSRPCAPTNSVVAPSRCYCDSRHTLPAKSRAVYSKPTELHTALNRPHLLDPKLIQSRLSGRSRLSWRCGYQR